jgi:hypothetical protein
METPPRKLAQAEPHMNKYLELLPIVADRGWRITREGLIRAERDRLEQCPICALSQEIEPASPWMNSFGLALKDIGLPADKDALAVANAADWPSHPLRPALMAALGMKP